MTNDLQDSQDVDDSAPEAPTEPPSAPDSDLVLELEEADYGSDIDA